VAHPTLKSPSIIQAKIAAFAAGILRTFVVNLCIVYDAIYTFYCIFRGNKGFFAMGNVNQEFTTGLPDGEKIAPKI
jgi:hypothetical protein